MSLGELQERIRLAGERATPLRPRGGGSKDFYGERLEGEVLDTRVHAGVSDYEPSELVLTARCGTALSEVEHLLEKNGQCLPFEPPHFGAATFGGCIAAGLSGPRRASVGALRDFVLGAQLIDGRGRLLAFGGRVMKNVAGYDVSRLLAGSLGTLGVIAEASVKVLPRPACEVTLQLEMPEARALDTMSRLAGQPLPVSATAWHDGMLSVRLSGSDSAVRAARSSIGGQEVADPWREIREHRHAFFAGEAPLWRVAVPSTAPALGLAGGQLIEWHGALRWLRGPSSAVREAARQRGGHATLFRAADKSAGAFTPLAPAQLRLHRALKGAFDPAGIFSRGRMYDAL
ncbi:MAG TPA: glycolate oxidase subunit GlcE [Burkholderiales bacterium]|nr:glycolate oxidase subunit GlcE [Burkholderiales bacterium]